MTLTLTLATRKNRRTPMHVRMHPCPSCRSGDHVIAFLDRGPLCLLGVSPLGEPPAVLRMQLALVHGQIVSLVTSSALDSIFRWGLPAHGSGMAAAARGVYVWM
jgi:hypothetical protein